MSKKLFTVRFFHSVCNSIRSSVDLDWSLNSIGIELYLMVFTPLPIVVKLNIILTEIVLNILIDIVFQVSLLACL
jgi:hypothetical protein